MRKSKDRKVKKSSTKQAEYTTTPYLVLESGKVKSECCPDENEILSMSLTALERVPKNIMAAWSEVLSGYVREPRDSLYKTCWLYRFDFSCERSQGSCLLDFRKTNGSEYGFTFYINIPNFEQVFFYCSKGPKSGYSRERNSDSILN